MNENERYELAKKRAEMKLGFYVHAAIFVAVNLLLLFINLTTDSTNWWFIWPLLGWGIGLFVHGVLVFFDTRTTALKEKMIRAELSRDS